MSESARAAAIIRPPDPTPRQLAVLDAYAETGTYELTAAITGISPGTVRNMLIEVRAHYGAATTIHAYRAALAAGDLSVSRPRRDDSIHDRRDHDDRALAAGGTRASGRPDRLPGAQTDTSPHQELIVKEAHARANVARERARIEASLTGLDGDIRAAESLRGQQTGELEEGASGLETESVDVALAASLRAELAAVGRAEERMTDGTYGRSVQSGLPIPDERLAVEPLAERTVEEQTLHEAAGLR